MVVCLVREGGDPENFREVDRLVKYLKIWLDSVGSHTDRWGKNGFRRASVFFGDVQIFTKKWLDFGVVHELHGSCHVQIYDFDVITV